MRKRYFTGVLPFSVFRTEKNDSTSQTKIINIKILKKYEVVWLLWCASWYINFTLFRCPIFFKHLSQTPKLC